MADGMTKPARFLPGAARLETATPLLRFLAGPHAEAIAAVWPSPHKGFLALPAARRHAAAILLARGERDLAGLAAGVERHRDSAIARRLAGHGDTAGLMKALARMGETQWQAGDYERFLQLFADPRANRVLRHMAEIRPGQLALIHALPPALREAAVVEKVPGLQAARDIALALDLAARIHGAREAGRIGERMRRAKSVAALFDKAVAALQPHRFERPASAPTLPAPFEAVADRKALEAMALEFRNCLRDFTGEMALGHMAAYAWRGEPPIVLALRWDAAGWRLAEAELADNEPAPEAALRLIVGALDRAGVRTGPGLVTLAGRLGRHKHGVVEPVARDWTEALELGQLWE